MQRGGGFALEDVAHLERQAFAQFDVEVGERLVHQDQARPRRQGAGQRHALLLAAGELVRELVGVAGQADQFEQFGDACLFAVAAEPSQAEADVLRHRQVRKQRVILEHHADAALFGGVASSRGG
jgi:hypothetical protein